MKEYVEIRIHLYDNCGFWNREIQSENRGSSYGIFYKGDKKSRMKILNEMAEDGWKLLDIRPGTRDGMAEHWQPEVLLFERNKAYT